MARTRAQDYDAKRSVILHRAARLFAQYGYSGSSITMIAEPSPITNPSRPRSHGREAPWGSSLRWAN